MGHSVAFSVKRDKEGALDEAEVASVLSVLIFVRPRNGQAFLNLAREESLSIIIVKVRWKVWRRFGKRDTSDSLI